MEHLVCQNERHWVETLNARLVSAAARCAHPKIYLPAGETPRPLYRYWREQGLNGLDHAEFLQIDEILNGENRFARFFKEELAGVAGKMIFLGGGAGQFRQGDIAVLGLGLNGHVGFHEPGVPRSFAHGCVRLLDETCDRLHVERGTWGISYGLGAFINCAEVFLIVRGGSKREILKRVLSGDRDLPATMLLEHPNAVVISDFRV